LTAKPERLDAQLDDRRALQKSERWPLQAFQ